MPIDLGSARSRVRQLHADLVLIVERDAEQEIEGWAVPVLDALVDELRRLLPDDPIIARLRDVMSPEAIAEGAVRSADLLPVVGQVLAAIPAPGTRISSPAGHVLPTRQQPRLPEGF